MFESRRASLLCSGKGRGKDGYVCEGPIGVNIDVLRGVFIILTTHHAILQNHQSRSGVPPLTSWTQYVGGMFLERQHR